MLRLLQSSEQWAKELLPDDLAIMDADGWDRGNFEASWQEPISRTQFLTRLNRSTLLRNFRALDKLEAEEKELNDAT